MITCRIQFEEDIENLYKIFLPEIEASKTERAEYTLEKADKLILSIKARDIPRFKSYVSTVIKTLDAYSKA